MMNNGRNLKGQRQISVAIKGGIVRKERNTRRVKEKKRDEITQKQDRQRGMKEDKEDKIKGKKRDEKNKRHNNSKGKINSH